MNYKLWADELLDYYTTVETVYFIHKEVVCAILEFMKEFNDRDEWTDEQRDAVVLFTDEMIREAINNRPPEFVVPCIDIDAQAKKYIAEGKRPKAYTLMDFNRDYVVKHYLKYIKPNLKPTKEIEK